MISFIRNEVERTCTKKKTTEPYTVKIIMITTVVMEFKSQEPSWLYIHSSTSEEFLHGPYNLLLTTMRLTINLNRLALPTKDSENNLK